MYAAGALQTLLDQLNKYKIRITAIQETKWLGKEIMELKSHVVLKSRKGKGNREFGVAFVVSKDLKQAITQFKAVDERLCAIRIQTMFFNMWMINVHAPTENKEEETKEEFYLKLERLYDSLPTNDIKIVVGDMNAKIGKENIYKGTIGNHSLHQESNENSQRLISFAASRNLVISSTWFPHKNVHKATWRSPDGVTTNQIDHILIERRFASNILDVRSLKGADCETDHYLVRTKFHH